MRNLVICYFVLRTKATIVAFVAKGLMPDLKNRNDVMLSYHYGLYTQRKKMIELMHRHTILFGKETRNFL